MCGRCEMASKINIMVLLGTSVKELMKFFKTTVILEMFEEDLHFHLEISSQHIRLLNKFWEWVGAHYSRLEQNKWSKLNTISLALFKAFLQFQKFVLVMQIIPLWGHNHIRCMEIDQWSTHSVWCWSCRRRPSHCMVRNGSPQVPYKHMSLEKRTSTNHWSIQWDSYLVVLQT